MRLVCFQVLFVMKEKQSWIFSDYVWTEKTMPKKWNIRIKNSTFLSKPQDMHKEKVCILKKIMHECPCLVRSKHSHKRVACKALEFVLTLKLICRAGRNHETI